MSENNIVDFRKKHERNEIFKAVRDAIANSRYSGEHIGLGKVIMYSIYVEVGSVMFKFAVQFRDNKVYSTECFSVGNTGRNVKLGAMVVDKDYAALALKEFFESRMEGGRLRLTM